MATTRGEMTDEIFEILGRNSTAAGFLTPVKAAAALRDSLDFIASNMMKIAGGWLTKVAYGSIVADSPYVDLPAGLAIINSVKIKQSGSTEYIPLSFNDGSNATTSTESAGTDLYMPRYSFSNGKLYLEPTPDASITNGIRFDATYYPDKLTSDGASISGDLDNRTFLNYAKWRTASVLFNLTTREAPPWVATELEWKKACMEIIARRFREPTFNREFPN